MKITNISRLCDLAVKSLDEALIPELQTSAAKNAAAFVKDALRAASRRSTAGESELMDINRSGLELARLIDGALSSHGVATAGQDLEAPTISMGFENAARTQEQLSDYLASLVDKFSENVPVIQRTAADATLLRRIAKWELDCTLKMANSPGDVISSATARPLSKEALEVFIQNVHPAGSGVNIIHLNRVSGGFGKQTYLLKIKDNAGNDTDLVVRKEDAIPLCSHPSFDLEREFHIVQALYRTGFPVPKPLWFGSKVSGIDASFYIVTHLAGSIGGSFLGGAAKLPDTLALEFAELLARLHQIPLQTFAQVVQVHEDNAVLTETVTQGYHRQLSSWRQHFNAAKLLPSPLMSYMFDWLESNVVNDQGHPVLVHGDYSIHNVLVADGHITGVLDWEAALFGAPEIDLAYVRLALEKHIDWDRFTEHYHAKGGKHVDNSTLNYHLAFQITKIMVAMVSAHTSMIGKKSDDIRMTAFELAFLPQFMQIAFGATEVSAN